MKSFVRTLPGKVLLYFLCLLFFSTAVGSGIGVFALFQGDVYSHSEVAVLDNVESNLLYSALDDELFNLMRRQDDDQRSQALREDSNIVLKITDSNGNVVVCDDGYDELAGSIRVSVSDIRLGTDGQGYYYIVGFGNSYSYADQENGETAASEDALYTAELALRAELTAKDRYAQAAEWVHLAYSLRYALFVIGAAALLLGIVCYVALLAASGRRQGQEEVCLGPLGRVPFDLLAAVTVFASFCLVFGLESVAADTMMEIVVIVGGVLLFTALFLGLSMSAATRIKKRILLRNSVVGYCCRGSWRLCRLLARGIVCLPLVWRTALVLLAVSLFEFIVLAGFGGLTEELFGWWLLEKVLVIPTVLYVALMLRRLQQGARKLAAGELDYQTDTGRMILDLKSSGENLNSISAGMSAAVEQKMKSERMKTELITNVSHDIKTPLTSIINYAGLIEQEPCENETIKEYAAVLSRQSSRLKRLIEDLVEASKASSGNLEVNLTVCDTAVLVSQAAGEYEGKLSEAGLTLVTSVPENPIHIMADGRRLWRVFDNLLNNAKKYALPGTRVYLNLEQIGQRAVITLKNVSREPLNVSAEELMERFVRGDQSRNTEGNGLGLSIARSLTELQGGTLLLTVDGDLFKAMLSFPVVTSPLQSAG